ncbi:cadherin domain-containing protein [Thiofilum flexile]|uniref:cadherin domain-containing protein n=1 Tax=Thiofilum flexile TaxID=125627 RepID=UPI00036A254E|nr:cadherin domain-containing protein [Thiofilum flexile]
MLKIASFKVKLYWLYSLFLLLFYFPVPALAAVPAIGGSSTCTATGGTDVLFLVDDSGSVTDAEYTEFAATIVNIGNTLLAANPATRLAVAHYAGPDTGPEIGQQIFLERDFSTAALSSPVRHFAQTLLYTDHLAGSVYQVSYALDGDAATTSSYIVSPLKELSRDLNRPLQIVDFTDAMRAESYGTAVLPGEASAMIDIPGYDYEPNDASNFTIFNILKNQGVKFSVALLSSPAPAVTNPAAAAIASVGGSWTGAIEDNPVDPEGSKTLPRRFETSATTFTLSATQITNFVTPIANMCPYNVNAAPVISSNGGGDTAAISVAENQTAVTTVTATDADGDTLTYSITGGADAAKFTINSSTGVLQFATAPDYEAPTDSGANNVYDVQVTVSDGRGGTDLQTIAVTVTDVAESIPVIGGSGTCTATGGTDVVFLLDNSGSVLAAEYTEYASTVVSIGNALRTANPATRIAVAHFAGPLSGIPFSDYGQYLSLERDFSTAALSSPVRQFPSIYNYGEDNLAGAVTQLSYALDGNASTTSSFVLSSLKELNRDLTRPLQIVIFTDAYRDGSVAGSAMIDGVGYGYEPNDGSNFTIYNLLKAQGVKFSVAALTLPNGITADERDKAAAAIASVGGSWTGIIESNPVDPEGSQTSPRRYETSSTFTLSAAQISNFVTSIANICGPNVAPVITSNGGGATAAISVAENQTAVTTVTATDADGDTLTYSITGGADAAKFTIDSSTGVLQFATAPDFETPTDSGGNNVYDVQVTVSDGNGGTDMQDIAVTVTDVAENVAPVITSNGGGDTAAISVAENQTAVTTVTATDADGDTLTYSITGGADAALFTIDNSTGVLQFVTAPDYEAPTDTGADNVYDVQVTVSDGKGGTDMQAISVTVTDVAENVAPVITSNGGGDTASISVAENQTAVTTVTATDVDGDNLTYSITGGADAAKFTIDNSTGVLQFVTAPDYENPTDTGADNVYDVQVTVSDGKGGTDMQAISVTVTDVAEGGVVLQVRGFLQGPFSSETQLMYDSLRTKNLIPSTQPYTAAPFNYSGTEQLNAALLTVSDSNAIVDWVLVELRNATNPSTLVAQKAALLQRDGDVVTADTGSVDLTFASVAAGNYYVVLRHRNHLGVMSASALALSPVPSLVDFTLSATAVYGSYARLEVDSKAVMWAGDANKSNQVIANGPNNDVNDLLGPVLVYESNSLLNSNYQLAGYRISDIDMNGYTLFAGPSNDTNIVIGNVLMHPSNTSLSANFVIPGTIPNVQ